MNKRYDYVGAVYAFGKPIADQWKASTYAPTEAKAVSNLKHRFRVGMGLVAHVPIKLDGKITVS